RRPGAPGRAGGRAPPPSGTPRHDGEGLRQMRRMLDVRPADLVYSNGLGWAVEEVQAITHTGTHVDAPYHYGPTSEGRPARTIDQVPLEWCFAPGVALDVRHKRPGDEITVADLQAALDAINYRLRPRDIVLLHTGADKRLHSPDYFAQPGLGRDGVLWLVGQGVKVIGIDAYTLDRPFANMVADYRRDRRRPGRGRRTGPDGGRLPGGVRPRLRQAQAGAARHGLCEENGRFKQRGHSLGRGFLFTALIPSRETVART